MRTNSPPQSCHPSVRPTPSAGQDEYAPHRQAGRDRIELPIVEGSLALILKLARRELTVDQSRPRSRNCITRLDLPRTLASLDRAWHSWRSRIRRLPTDAPPAARPSALLYRAREVHPPHCHHNVISSSRPSGTDPRARVRTASRAEDGTIPGAPALRRDCSESAEG